MEVEYDLAIRITQRLDFKAARAAWEDHTALDKGTIGPWFLVHSGLPEAIHDQHTQCLSPLHAEMSPGVLSGRRD